MKIYKTILVHFLILPLFVFAAGVSVRTVVNTIAYYLGYAAVAIGAALVAFGIYKIATSVGNPPALTEGLHYIIWGAVGILLGVLLQNAGDWLSEFGISI